MADLKSSIENYQNALNSLKKFLSTPVVDERDRAGVIQAFEYTYELSWKTVHKFAQFQGEESVGPRGAFEFAFKNNLIPSEDEKLFIAMMKDRNLSTHTYREKTAQSLFENIQNNYVRILEGLLGKLSQIPLPPK